MKKCEKNRNIEAENISKSEMIWRRKVEIEAWLKWRRKFEKKTESEESW